MKYAPLIAILLLLLGIQSPEPLGSVLVAGSLILGLVWLANAHGDSRARKDFEHFGGE
jgi:hypothetical protein